VLAAGVVERDLLVAHVGGHALGVALEGVAVAAAARLLVQDDVAAAQGGGELGRHLARLAVGVQHVTGAAGRPAAGQAVRTEGDPIGTQLQRSSAAFEKAKGQLSTGRGSAVSLAEKMIELGVTPTGGRRLPESLTRGTEETEADRDEPQLPAG